MIFQLSLDDFSDFMFLSFAGKLILCCLKEHRVQNVFVCYCEAHKYLFLIKFLSIHCFIEPHAQTATIVSDSRV